MPGFGSRLGRGMWRGGRLLGERNTDLETETLLGGRGPRGGALGAVAGGLEESGSKVKSFEACQGQEGAS